jgi:hypothetical protein
MLTVIIAIVHYSYDFGHLAIVLGIVVILLFLIMRTVFQYTRNAAILGIYGLFNVAIIVGAGLVDGFWNHAFKLFIYYLHNGYIPPLLAHLFQNTTIGNTWYEATGVLTFVASMFAAYFTYRFFMARHDDHNTSNYGG